MKMTIDGVTATATEKEVLTAGRVGLRCAFEFSGGDWGGLFKTAVFQGIETVDVALTDNECVVPWEAMAVEGVQLKVGVYGANGNGDIVIPTVWANFGKIQPSAIPSGTDPQAPTQNANAYAVETAEQALEIAQSVETRADNGEFIGPQGPTGQTGNSGVYIGESAPTDPDVDVWIDTDGDPDSEIYTTAEKAKLASLSASAQIPQGGTTSQVLKKVSGTDYDVEWADESGGGGTTEIFWAEDSATTADIYNAIQAGKLPLRKDSNGRVYVFLKQSGNNFIFAAVDGMTLYEETRNLSGWESSVAQFGTYRKPSGGIPKTDLASAVQTSLGKADTALQSYTETDPTVPSWAKAASKPSYTASEVGAIAAPGSPSAGDVLTYSSGAWAAAAPVHQIPSGGNAGECLAKNSATDYDLRWRTINDWTPAGLMRTNGGTAAKVAEWSFWSATQYPSWLVVTVGNSNTYAGAITLKVNGSTAYPIYINGAASSATNYTLPAGSYFVYFDGSKFDFRTDGKIPGDITGHAGGDIAAPASPTTGDFLCWNGSAWAATSMSAWQGGNY